MCKIAEKLKCTQKTNPCVNYNPFKDAPNTQFRPHINNQMVYQHIGCTYTHIHTPTARKAACKQNTLTHNVYLLDS